MNELADVIAFVSDWPPFDRLNEAQLADLCRHIEISYETKNTELLGWGADNQELYLIRKGAVTLHDERGQFVDQRAEGALVGYPSLLTGEPSQFAVRTLEDSLIYHLPGEYVRQLRAQVPGLDRYFTAKLIDRINSGQFIRSASVESLCIAEVMSQPAVSAEHTVSVAEAAQLMSSRRVSALPITKAGRLVGLITDRDLRDRVVAQNLSYTTSAVNVMTRELVTADASDSVLQAQLTMLERGVHHLPVCEGDQLTGMITLSDILRTEQNDPVHFIARLRRSSSAEEVVRRARKRKTLFISLVQSGVDALHVQRVMTAITDVTTSRLIGFAQSKLGSPPMSYAWIALGSQARREQTFRTDQDNGLVLEREPDDVEGKYFERLANFVCENLNEAGFVFCPGGIMASTPQWRMSLEGWKQHYSNWITAPESKALMFASIFFDQRCIHGERNLISQLREHVFGLTKTNSLFLAFMRGNALEQSPPLSFFRQFILEEEGKQQEGLNLKHRGVVPIVSLARLKALEYGIHAADTVSRLRIAIDHHSNRDDMNDLIDALDLIGRVRNEQQVEQLTQGNHATNLVHPKDLSPLTRRHLKAAFNVVRRAQQTARAYSIT